MNSGKKISALWNKFLCFLLGHTHTFICERCGKIVNEEDNDNCWKRFRFYLYGHNREYKGSLRIKSGTQKYELDMKTNELRVLEFEVVENKRHYGAGCKVQTHLRIYRCHQRCQCHPKGEQLPVWR